MRTRFRRWANQSGEWIAARLRCDGPSLYRQSPHFAPPAPMPWRRRLAFWLARVIVQCYTGAPGERLRDYTQIEHDRAAKQYRITIQSRRVTALLINFRPVRIRYDLKQVYPRKEATL